jgi:membrane-associated protease RseP (regulator of RpoE activity)
MSFVLYDLSFLVVFTLAIVIFLYTRKHNLKRDGLMYLYRTSVGLKIIDTPGKKYPKTLRVLSYIIVACGYILMVAMIYFLVEVVRVFLNPAFVQAIKIPPLMPLIPYLPDLFRVTWLPPFYFTYWIIAIALVAIFHEGFHGIFARFYNVKIKSTGFGFLGPFLAFFVEQDDKQMQQKKIFPQLTILGAGVFANILLGIIFFFVMIGSYNVSYTPSGVVFNDYSYSLFTPLQMQNLTLNGKILAVDGLNLTGITILEKNYFISPEYFKLNQSDFTETTLIKAYQDLPAINNQISGAIRKINEVPVNNQKDFVNEMSLHKPGENITLTTNSLDLKNQTTKTYSMVLGADYNNSSRAVIGTAVLQPNGRGMRMMMYKLMNYFREPGVNYEPKSHQEFTIFIYNLLWWIVLINFSVALTNMLPMGIFDGGRFYYLTILAITKKKKLAEQVFKWTTKIILGVFALLMVLWAWGMFR